MTDRSLFPAPRALRDAVPLWPYGLEGPWLARELTRHTTAAAARSPKLAAVAAALAGWLFERDPLDPVFAAGARAACRAGVASPRQRSLLAHLAKRLRPPADVADWAARRDAPDPEPAILFLRRAMDDPAHGLFWHGRAFAFALARGLEALARETVGRLGADAALAPLGARLAVEAAFAWNGPAAGLAALERVDPELFPRFCALAKTHGLAETGQDVPAREGLVRLWRAENWHPGLTLALHARLHPPAAVALDALPGRLFVFLYSWNRSDLLAATLESLRHSRLGPARLVVLDNGSTDDTPAVCRAAEARFGRERFTAIRLAVNVGAPAARNWLAAASGLGPDDLAAYVDDDVSLPPDWLERLVSTLAADPLADVAGARIVAAAPGAARAVQAADVRLLPPDDRHAVRPLVNSGPGPDFGLLAADRPCASVSGCCHLFRGSALAGPAPFDIRFSPSQFDDLTRDLHGFLAGRRAVCAGALAVAHHQHAGPGQAKSRKAVGQLLGARTKLDGLFSPSDMTAAAARDLDTAWDELEAKWEALREECLAAR